MMEQRARIEHMEERFNAVTQVMQELEAALEKYEGVMQAMDELDDYYHSEAWMQDYDAQRAGKFPEGLRCGVLSEDGVDTILWQKQALVEKARKLLG